MADTGGPGAPLVLLHGSGASHHVFRPLMSNIAFAKNRIIALDFPGHGLSDNALSHATYSFSGLARCTQAVLTMLSVHNPVIAGWSLGGHVALELASIGYAVSGIALFGTPPLSRGPFGFFSAFQPRLDMLLVAKAQFSEQDAGQFGNLIYGKALNAEGLQMIRRADGNCRAHIAKSIFRNEGINQRRFVEQSKVPIAIINGANDPLLKLRYFDTLKSPALWGGQCHEIERAGHASFLDQPAAFALLLRSFADFSTGAVPEKSTIAMKAVSHI